MSPELSEPISIQQANSSRKWAFASKRLRQLRKLIRILPSQGFRRGLRYGVAASMENHTLMKSIRPATLIDVGANVGQFSLLIRTLYPDAYIHAFEPLSRPAGRFARLFKGILPLYTAVQLVRVPAAPRCMLQKTMTAHPCWLPFFPRQLGSRRSRFAAWMKF